ncbi:hypothetical protein JYK00_05755 [Thermosipho ferrireducens]|uniref:DUF4352 domain-containing protein n=1 Tax=Thermosipho ferrireducens TaxID=2571116 RepID=A0ABX7S7J5_9BACT|nr:hypothetical protein [Thermosipho ferrireducens]QTA37248.1 hypothetical protein JYK00_05755 [Thermosipho ferrireducens]
MQNNYNKLREEKEKKLKEEINAYRRRSVYYLFINIFIVVILVFVVMKFRAPISTTSQIVDGYQFIIKTSQEYYSDEQIKARVYIINTRNRNRKFVLNYFKFSIERKDGQSIYNFDYNSQISSEIEALKSRLVFELEREAYLSRLKSGEYLIKAEALINGKKLSTTNYFVVKEEVTYTLQVDPFYVVNEEFLPKLVVRNRTSSPTDLRVKSIVWKIEKSDVGKVIFVNKQEKENTYSINSGEVLIFEPEKTFVVKSKGIYNVKTVLTVNDIVKSSAIGIRVIDFPERTYKNIQANVYSDELLLAKKKVTLHVSLTNKSSKERFLKFSSLSLLIPEINYNYEISNSKVYIPPSGSEIALTVPVFFPKGGKYTFVIQLVGQERKTFSYEVEIP